MLASIHSGSSTKVWPEIVRESEKHLCTLFIFPGGRLGSREEYEYMRNAIFPLVRARSFDGAISWASSLSGSVSEKQVEYFHLQQVDLPLVTIGLKIGSNPVVNIDAYAGMKQLIFHLTKKHKCKRIAFLGGPREHSSAEDRFRAYRDALAESGLAFDEKLVSLDNPWTGGRKAVSLLLDTNSLEPGKDFDALCGASDLLIFEAAKLLQERGYRVPSDIALGGFNDSDESNLFSPTYTTVHMPFERQAVQAFHMLLDMLEEKKPTDRLLKTKLVIRQSCGCLPESVQMAGTAGSSKWKRMAKMPAKPPLSDVVRYMSSITGFDAESTKKYLEPLASAFLESLAGRSGTAFMGTLDSVINDFIFQERDIAVLQDVLSAIRICCEGHASSHSAHAVLDSLIHQARVLVSDAEKRMSNYRVWKEKSIDHWLSILNHELLCAKDFGSIVRIAGCYLPRLDIQSGFFVLNDENPEYRIFIGGFTADGTHESAARILEAKNGRMRFSSGLILPEEFYPGNRGAFIVLPLYYESTSLGYMILQVHDNAAYIFEEIRAQISGAMRGVLLFEQVNEARKRAEKAERLKTEFLAGISGELQEPIDSIFSIASRLLEKGGSELKEDIETIAAFSSRQMELTRHLLDLSLAQVDDLALDRTLFTPRLFMQNLSVLFSAKQKKNRWGRIAYEEYKGHLPLVFGDQARITQILEIFLDCFFRELEAARTEITIVPSKNGIDFKVSGTIDASKRKDKIQELYAVINSTAGLASFDKMKIEVELAKRIAFLHGGTIGISNSSPEFGLRVVLPYPAIDDSLSKEAVDENGSYIAALGQEPLPPEPGSSPPYTEIRSLGISDIVASNPALDDIALLYLDPTMLSADTAVTLGLLLENEKLQKKGWFLEADGIPDSMAARNSSLRELLRTFVVAKDSNEILIFASGDRENTEVTRLEKGIVASGHRILHCRNTEELQLIAGRDSPPLLVLIGQNSLFLETIDALPGLANTPLLCIAKKFDDAEFEKHMLNRPKSLICNSGGVFGDVILSRINAILAGEELLPAPTAAIITRTIFFLNRCFREQMSRWKLSEHINASEDYLSRIFHRQMGIPLWEYLNKLRIEYAIELLKVSGESVSEIAFRSGFQDQAYFCRVFRKITGKTPGAVRKSSDTNDRKVQ